MPDDDPERSEEEEEEESEISPMDETDEKTKNRDKANGSAVRKKRMTMPLIYQLYQSKVCDLLLLFSNIFLFMRMKNCKCIIGSS